MLDEGDHAEVMVSVKRSWWSKNEQPHAMISILSLRRIMMGAFLYA